MNKHIPALDGLRALAVLAVIGFHMHVPHMGGGYMGVDVFFVLSGFLITSILLSEEAAGGIRLVKFYLRRARRLYPALLGMVALYLLTDSKSLVAWQDAGIALAYLSDYSVAFWHRPMVLQHTWSLAVEEHFYLLWPLLLPFVAKLPRKGIVYLLGAVFIADTVWRMYVDQFAGYGAGFRFDTRLTGLTLGCLIAFLPRREFPWWIPYAVFVALAAWLWSPPGFMLPILLGPGLTMMEIAAAFAVLWAANGARVLSWEPLAYIGRISYGLYLYHYPIYLLVRTTTTDWRVIALWTVPATFALAMLSYHTIEARFRRAPVIPTGNILTAASS